MDLEVAVEKTWDRIHLVQLQMKKTNYALQPQSREEFIKSVTHGLTDAPRYFTINAKINQEGYDPVSEVKSRGTRKLTISEFKEKLKEDTIILDTRPATQFTQGFIPGSVFIGLEGRFAEWAGCILPFDKPLFLITTPGTEEETVIRLARVGFDKMAGVLDGGFDSWKNAAEKTDMIVDIEADELIMDLPHDNNITVLDVRREAEFGDGHLKDSVNFPLSEMTDLVQIARFNDNQNLYIHCAGGYRSVIAASLLKGRVCIT